MTENPEDTSPHPSDVAGAVAPATGSAQTVTSTRDLSRLRGRDVAVRRRRTWLLPPTSFEIDTGTVTLAVGTPDDRHTLLALAVAGRLAGADGGVTLDGQADQERIQREVALVDVPGVTAPEPVLPVRAVVGEELAMAGRKAWGRDVNAWLSDLGATGTILGGGELIGDIDPAARIRLMTELALLREPRFVVLALPERHGALPADWWPVAVDAAKRGAGVFVTASATAAAHIKDAAHVANIGSDTAVLAASASEAPPAGEPAASVGTDDAETGTTTHPTTGDDSEGAAS